MDDIVGVEGWEGAKLPVQFRRRSVGGGAANVAIAHRRLSPGARLVLVAATGSDEAGRYLRRRMREERIAMPLPPVRGAATSRSTVIVPRQGGSRILTEANVREHPLPLAEVERQLQRASICCLVSPTCNEQIAEIASMAHARRVPLYFGLSGRQTKSLTLPELAAMLAPGAAMVMCNELESKQLTGCEHVEESLHAMQRLARLVVISCGERGLVALRDGRVYRQAAWSDPRHAFVDDTGCGDAALAGVVDGLATRLPLPTALAVGVRLAFAAGTAWGASAGLVNFAKPQAALSA